MVLDQLYRLRVNLDEERFNELEKSAWNEGFDEPEQLVDCLINKYLRAEAQKVRNDYGLKFYEESMDELDRILFYSRLMNFIDRSLNSLGWNIFFFFREARKLDKQMIVNKHCGDGMNLGEILRAAKSNFSNQANRYETFIVYNWLLQVYPLQKTTIQNQMLLPHTH